MWARLRRFSALPGAAKSDFVEAALLLPWIRLSLRLRGFRATQQSLLQRAEPAAAALPETAAAALTEQVCRMVLAASRHSLLRTTCLERSLTLWRILARRGVSSQLRIGTSKCDGKFAAHAWVERNGEAIGEPEGTHLHYAAFEKEFGGESG